jgi:hypothetical protein
MPRTRSNRSARANHRTARLNFAQPVQPVAPKVIRGVKLRTVSAFMLAFSLLCLAAFVAGRPPIPHQARRAPFPRIQASDKPKLKATSCLP